MAPNRRCGGNQVNVSLPLRWALFAIAALLAAPRGALALKPVVVDGADLFRQDTIDEVNGLIRQIKARHGKDLMVETYAKVPEELREPLRRQGRDAFFAE